MDTKHFMHIDFMVACNILPVHLTDMVESSRTKTCSKTHSSLKFTCIAWFFKLQCCLPTTVDNGYLRAITGYKVADTAHYGCNFGFEMSRSDFS